MLLKDRPIRWKLMAMILLTSGVVLLLTCAAFFAYEFLTFRQATIRQSAQNKGVFSAFGFLAASLAAINPLQIWYAQEARMYSLVVALCAGAAWCLARHPAENRCRRHRDEVWSRLIGCCDTTSNPGRRLCEINRRGV